MSAEYTSIINQLRSLADKNLYLRNEMNHAADLFDKLRASGTTFDDALMTFPFMWGKQFLEWIGYLDIDIPHKFVDDYAASIPWDVVSMSLFAPINPSFVDKYADHLDWDGLCWGLKEGSEDMLRKHDRRVNWESLSWTSMPLSFQFVYEYADKLDWEGVFTKKKFRYPYKVMKSNRAQLKKELASAQKV